jgi:hypothetical protein
VRKGQAKRFNLAVQQRLTLSTGSSNLARLAPHVGTPFFRCTTKVGASGFNIFLDQTTLAYHIQQCGKFSCAFTHIRAILV